MKYKISGTLVLTFVYAIVRYVVFGQVSPIHIPVYLLNKSVSMAAVLFLFYAAINYLRNQKELSTKWGSVSFHCALIHILLSFSIFARSYYPKFYLQEKLSLTGELVVLFGVFGGYFYWLIRKYAATSNKLIIYKILASLSIGLHMIFMGLPGWLQIEKWHGFLPPISLICGIFAVASLSIY